MTGVSDKGGPHGGYKVGYGRPPAQHRFAKGTSGNPKGRPKTKSNASRRNTLLEHLERLAHRRISLVLNGRPTSLTMLEAILVKTQQQALEGKQDAVRTLLSLHAKIDQIRKEYPPTISMADVRAVDPHEAMKVYQEFINGRA